MRREGRWILMVALVGSIALQTLFSKEFVAEARDGKPTHGSSSSWITEEQLTENVEEGYQINKVTQGDAKDGLYNAYFLKDDIQTISIEIDENNLNYLFQNADAKPVVMANKVTIGDTTMAYVGLKTKGSYTLEHSYSDNPNSDRFSLTLNFGKYIKKKNYGENQNFYGVEKISLNNFFFDKSMMKEYCALMLMKEMGLPTPQFGLAKLYINGRYYGVYSMIEALDSPILQQYFGCSEKEVGKYLCKPEGTNFIYYNLNRDWSPMWEKDEDTLKKVEKTLPTLKDWVKKLNQLSDGQDFDGNNLDVNSEKYLELLSQVIDTDEFLRYFAAHSFLCQLDNMFVGQKNFGLYVGDDGKALLIPWDYDLSFGTYSPVTADATANYDIDLMFMQGGGGSVADFEKEEFYKEFPLFNVIYQNESLMDKYHKYMLDCSKIMALGGTTSFGAVCQPNEAYNRIETLTKSLTAAATEKTTARARYMNGISQPRDLKGGLQNLEKIIAMRSLGVFFQVEEMPGHVSGKGCNLAQVGNGQDNWSLKNFGTLAAIDPATGIFIRAKYQGDSPLLTVHELAATDPEYIKVSEQIKRNDNAYFKMYTLKDSADVKRQEAYLLSIPLGSEWEKQGVSVYSYYDGQLTRLRGDWTDGIFTTGMEKAGTIVITEGKSVSHNAFPTFLVIGIGSAALVIALSAFIFIKAAGKRGKKRG